MAHEIWPCLYCRTCYEPPYPLPPPPTATPSLPCHPPSYTSGPHHSGTREQGYSYNGQMVLHCLSGCACFGTFDSVAVVPEMGVI